MKNQKNQLTQIGRYVREVVKKEHPETVEHLVRLVQQERDLSEKEIMYIARRAGLRFTKRPTRALDLKHYATSASARWYWFIIAICILTITVVLIRPKNNVAIYLRYLLGSAFVFWMPGYCLIKNLFPGKRLERSELIALSLGTSIVLVPMIAFVLHYTPWGIKTMSVAIVLFILALVLSTLAIVREYQEVVQSGHDSC